MQILETSTNRFITYTSSSRIHALYVIITAFASLAAGLVFSMIQNGHRLVINAFVFMVIIMLAETGIIYAKDF